MNRIQGRIWNALSDDFRKVSVIIKQSDLPYSRNIITIEIRHMTDLGIIEHRVFGHRDHYRLPQPVFAYLMAKIR